MKMLKKKKTDSLSSRSTKSSREENHNPDGKGCSRDSLKDAVEVEKTKGRVWRWEEGRTCESFLEEVLPREECGVIRSRRGQLSQE